MCASAALTAVLSIIMAGLHPLLVCGRRGLLFAIIRLRRLRRCGDERNEAMSRLGWTSALIGVGVMLHLTAQAQALDQLIATAIGSHPSAQGQRALLESAEAGVDGARWQFYPTPSVTVEAANTRAQDGLYQGDSRVATLRLQQPLWTGGA